VIIYLHSINGLVFIMGTECVLREACNEI